MSESSGYLDLSDVKCPTCGQPNLSYVGHVRRANVRCLSCGGKFKADRYNVVPAEVES